MNFVDFFLVWVDIFEYDVLDVWIFYVKEVEEIIVC